MISNIDKFRGSLLGLAVGDALGTTLEFTIRGSFEPITDLVGGGPFDLKAGEWTDDTSMALCLAKSLLRCKGLNLDDQLQAYIRWFKQGENSVTGSCFDIGNTVCNALEDYELTGNPYSESTSPDSAGNGSIMRLCPIPLYFYNDSQKAIEYAAESSKTTHGAEEAVDACRYLAALIIGAIQGLEKEQILGSSLFELLKAPANLTKNINDILLGRYKTKDESRIIGPGYVVKSLEAAIWAFYHTNNFKDGALKAANLGDDADTTAAIYGQIAGAYYGVEGIPKDWLNKLAWRKKISNIADQLYEAANS